ncbi:hypothetical protein [Legionella parisiensis]|uniref:LglF n=1 Tax=Legionella parisiensis TaxID=45071 RepID=A0A097NYY1_9GAMM|nr:hypothetical protein [Legionella parisiensis]AIU36105.1 LglF [Legionella parisiensis]KTD44287.1 hypothetical protein Lpar_0373 [Legionella parisiensis]OEH46559.1 hypothetical protein lpari_02427 [Legionella parisiensis]STX71912.1 SidC homolog [Legionella parisiensis]
MQDKCELYDESQQDIQDVIGQHSSTSNLLNYASTSKGHLNFFKHMIDVRKLSYHEVRGEHDLVQEILRENIYLMVQKGTITDCSGRIFENTSAFEYALWALDEPMWVMMLECLSENEENKKILAILRAQYNQIKGKGVTYSLNGETMTEKHFDFENTIIKELQIQVNSKNAPSNWTAIDKQWRNGVGGAQKLLPMHVVHAYCSEDPFDSVSPFTSRSKPSQQFYNWVTHQYENWFTVISKLGSHFAIYKVGRKWAVGDDSAEGQDVAHDLNALKALFKTRTMAFFNLEARLEELMTLGTEPQVLQI